MIKLGEININIKLDIASSMILVGKCGTGKTRMIKDILRQVMKDYSRLDVFYVDEHGADCKEVKEIVGDSSINKIRALTEPELKSLHDVVKAQQNFRNQLIFGSGCKTLDELIGKEVQVFIIGGREYMPDDIIWYYEDGQQKWLLAYEYYDKKIKDGSSYLIKEQTIGKYHPTRLLLCFDEFYTLDMSAEGQKLVHDIALSVIRLGKVAYQTIILTTQRVEQHKEYWDIYKLASVKVYFHSGFDNEVDYKVLFNKELPTHTYRGCVTIESPDIEPIQDDDMVSEIYETIDKICTEHELEDFSLSDIKMLSQILKRKVVYLDKMFERRLLHIIEVVKELDFSDCDDMTISWNYVGKEVFVSLTINQLPSDYSISVKMLNMSDEDLIKNKDLCKYVG